MWLRRPTGRNQPGPLRIRTSSAVHRARRRSSSVQWGCVQGALRARTMTPLSPSAPARCSEAPDRRSRTHRRGLQRSGLGTDKSAAGDRRRAWDTDGAGVSLLESRHQTDHFYTTNWNELGSLAIGGGRTKASRATCSIPSRRRPFRCTATGIPTSAPTSTQQSGNELGSGKLGWSYEGIQEVRVRYREDGDRFRCTATGIPTSATTSTRQTGTNLALAIGGGRTKASSATYSDNPCPPRVRGTARHRRVLAAQPRRRSLFVHELEWC